MFVRRLATLLCVFALLLFPGTVCHGEESAVLVQAYTWGQNIDMYIAGEIKLESLGCKCSNQGLEIVDSGLLADKGVTVRTTILLDISASMPKDMRDTVKIFLHRLIQDIPENEQYKLVTFDEELTVLQDFTNDRYDLANAAEEIGFDGQESKIYDAIYNTMPKAEPVEGDPCYYRTIVITDGIDDTASGVTKEELYLNLQADTYPVEVVAVSSVEQSEAEKELSALTRISRGRYVNLYADGDLESVLSSLAADNIYWVRAKLPVELLDGSLRPFVLTDGTVSLQFDVRVSAMDLSAGEEDGPTEVPESSLENEALGEAPENDKSMESVDNAIPEENDAGDNTSAGTETGESSSSGGQKEVPFVLLIAAAAVVLVIVLIAVSGRKKKEKPAGKTDTSKTGGSTGGRYEDTEILGGGTAEGAKGSLYIKIRDVNHTEQVWDLPLSNTIMVGRVTECQICVADDSVSRQQCLIYLVENIPTIENKSKSNITRLNGETLNVPRMLRAGDKIKCGRMTLLVDSFYRVTGGSEGNLNKDTRFLNV